ncbi:hypothetical protein FQN52_008881 [Onygenales sp. PD_12]|nr:hypothetical protein FQN52_008881 [Onygenales sp. PD_12]
MLAVWEYASWGTQATLAASLFLDQRLTIITARASFPKSRQVHQAEHEMREFAVSWTRGHRAHPAGSLRDDSRNAETEDGL